MTGVILAGGASKRMGRDKAALAWGNSSLLAVILATMKEVFHDVIIVSSQPGHILPKAILCSDVYPKMGPLAGIHAALSAARTETVFVTACDMPWVTPEALRSMVAEASMHTDWDVVYPYDEKGIEPLFACYSKRCLPAMESALKKGRSKVIDTFSFFRCVGVPVARLGEKNMLKNINTPSEYEEACRVYDGTWRKNI